MAACRNTDPSLLSSLSSPRLRWSEVQDAVRSILPTARQNLDAVAALLDDRAKYDRAKVLGTEFLEFLEAVDYQKVREGGVGSLINRARVERSCLSLVPLGSIQASLQTNLQIYLKTYDLAYLPRSTLTR